MGKSSHFTFLSDNSVKESKFHYEHENNETLKNEVRSLYLDPYSAQSFAAISEKIYSDHIISHEQIDIAADESITSKSETIYDHFGNIKKKSVQTSTGKTLVTRYTYPYDYLPSSPSPFFPMRNIEISREMVNKNIISYPIETINSVIENNLEEVTGGQLQKFVLDPLTGIISLSSVSSLEIPGPISDFNSSSIQLVQGLDDFIGSYSDEYLKADSRYSGKIFYDKYDAKGNLLQYHLQGGEIHSYLRDYSNIYTIAEVRNGAHSDIAATSFEADSKGNWIFSGLPSNTGGSITGIQSYLFGSGNVITGTGLTFSKKYIISYWSKGNITVTGGVQSNNITGRTINGWTYREVTITGATTLTLSGATYIDELRLYPFDAQMTSYTYEPLVGMTSQTDANNNITYYEYDAFGRLSIIRDENNNILKKICYNYAGQPEDCGCTNLSPIWQNISTPLRCKISNNKNNGEQEQEQKDTNPCSPSYNQTRWIVTGINLSACPVPVICDNSNCSGENKKCINGVCKTGIKVFTASYSEGNRSYCVYHYEWSDGSWSENITMEVPFGMMCMIK